MLRFGFTLRVMVAGELIASPSQAVPPDNGPTPGTPTVQLPGSPHWPEALTSQVGTPSIVKEPDALSLGPLKVSNANGLDLKRIDSCRRGSLSTGSTLMAKRLPRPSIDIESGLSNAT